MRCFTGYNHDENQVHERDKMNYICPFCHSDNEISGDIICSGRVRCDNCNTIFPKVESIMPNPDKAIIDLIGKLVSRCDILSGRVDNIEDEIERLNHSDLSPQKTTYKPKVDWSLYARWHNYVAMDADGAWHSYLHKPECTRLCFDNDESEYQYIPAEYAPPFSGDWKDSLCERPS